MTQTIQRLKKPLRFSLRPLPSFSQDIFALQVILLSALIVGYPIWFGGLETYMNNSVHLAEIINLAQGNSWSEIGFCGFPLTTLHSPLWYGLLSLLVGKVGLPLLPVYGMVVFFAFIAPSIAVYNVAKKITGPLPSLLIALCILYQPTAIFGVGSFLGGAWTFAIGIAGVIWFSDLLLQSKRDLRSFFYQGILLAAIALTHHFALVAAVICFLTITIIRRTQNRLLFKPLLKQMIVFGLAALASSVYWLTSLMTSTIKLAQQTLKLDQIFLHLFIPTGQVQLFSQTKGSIWEELYFVDMLPMLLLTGLALLALFQFKNNRKYAHFFFGLGQTFTWIILLLLLLLFPLPLLGPAPWRFLFFSRIGIAFLASFGLLQIWRKYNLPIDISKGSVVLVLGFSLGLGALYSQPLHKIHKKQLQEEILDARITHAWLKHHQRPNWGRVYIQDTFNTEPASAALSQSHYLLLAGKGLKQPTIGSYYKIGTHKTQHWLRGDSGLIFGRLRPSFQRLQMRMRMSNTGIIVTSIQQSAKLFSRQPKMFKKLFSQGRFIVWRNQRHENRWVERQNRKIKVTDVSFQGNKISLQVDNQQRKNRLLLKSSWHPWWKIQKPKGIKVTSEPRTGLILLSNLPKGIYRVRLQWQRMKILDLVSLLGFFLLIIGILYTELFSETSS